MSDLLEQIQLYLQKSLELRDLSDPHDSDDLDSDGSPYHSLELDLSLKSEDLDLVDLLELLNISDEKIQKLEYILTQTVVGLESRKSRILNLLNRLRSRGLLTRKDISDTTIDFQDHPDNKSLNQKNRDSARRRAKALSLQSGLDLSRAALHTILKWEIAAGRQLPADAMIRSRLWSRQSNANIKDLSLSQIGRTKQTKRALKYFKNPIK